VEKQLTKEETLKGYLNNSEIKVIKILLMPVSHKELVNEIILDEFTRFYFFEKNLESLSKKIEYLFEIKKTLDFLLPQTNCFSSNGKIEDDFIHLYRKALTIRQALGVHRQSNSDNTKSTKHNSYSS
jgi:hypothetical protein